MSDKQPVWEAIREFQSLPSEQRKKLTAAVEGASPAMYVRELSCEVAESSGVDERITQRVLLGFASMIQAADPVDEQLIKWLAEMFFNGEMGELDPEITEDFKRVLLAPGLYLTAKAHSLLWGQGKQFESARTVTQIRPLFLTDVSKSTDVAVVTHELFIVIDEDGVKNTVSMLMSRRNLMMLKGVVNRALDKEANVRGDARLTILDGDRRDDS